MSVSLKEDEYHIYMTRLLSQSLSWILPANLKNHPLFLTDIPNWMEYHAKLNKKYRIFLHFISSFDGISYKVNKIQPPVLLFLIVYISFYISKYQLLQFSSTSFNIT